MAAGAICGGYLCRDDWRANMEVKWCFSCRKHHLHTWVVFYNPPEVEDWYGPFGEWRCAGCDRDNTLFPGWTRWPEE